MRLVARLRRCGIGLRIGALVSICACVCLTATIWLGWTSTTALALANFDVASLRTTTMLADTLAPSVRFGRKEAIEGAWAKLTHDPQAELAGVAAIGGKGVLAEWQAQPGADIFATLANDPASPVVVRRLAAMTLVQVPVLQANGERVGTLRAAWSHAATAASIRAATLRQMALSAVAMGALILVLTLALRLAVITPLTRLAGAMVRVQQGDLRSVTPSVARGDEIGVLAKALDQFKGSLSRADQLTAEREQEKQAAATNRKTAMSRTADAFEAKVGNLVSMLSSGATELKATAESMSRTATQTTRQAASVVSATGGGERQRADRRRRRQTVVGLDPRDQPSGGAIR